MAAYSWCRLWNELPWDRKIRRLAVEHRYLFIVCMALASASPERGHLLLDSSDDAREVLTLADIADAAAMSVADVRDGMVMLGAAGLVEPIDPGDERHTYDLPVLDEAGTVPTLYVLPKWGDRQFEGDKPSTERVKRYRERQRKARNGGETLGETFQERASTVPETVSENREQRTEQKVKSTVAASGDGAPLTLAVQHVEPQGVDLDELRDVYPRHPDSGKPWGGAAKLDVVKAWAKLTSDEQRACVPASRHYAEACGRAGGDRPKHMSTWLNARGWEDWQDPAQPAALAVRNGQGHVASNVARTEANRDVIRGVLGRREATG